MLTLRKRGKMCHVDSREHTLRGTLGTRNEDAANHMIHRLEIALSEGPRSTLWPELSSVLPPPTYLRFAKLVGVKESQQYKWDDLLQSYRNRMDLRIRINKFRESSADIYERTLREFDIFLRENKVSLLREIDQPLIDAFKIWRIKRIENNSGTGKSILLDARVLHAVFAYALENARIAKNPVRLEGNSQENPEGGAEPFSDDELRRLREHAGSDFLLFLLFRWTGLRESDARTLSWEEISFQTKELDRVTQKYRKRVIVPMHSELLVALKADHERRNPRPSDTVLLNPNTGAPFVINSIYDHVVALGKRAGVQHAHPHRFRDTFAIDLLMRGASIYDVAKLLGDTVKTVERYYSRYVRELRERLRSILETGRGLGDQT